MKHEIFDDNSKKLTSIKKSKEIHGDKDQEWKLKGGVSP